MKIEKRICKLNLYSVFLCSDDRLTRLQDLRSKLIERFDAKKVAAWMYAQSSLTFRELETVKCSRTLTKAAAKLVDIVLTTTSENTFNYFLMGLNETNQQHISSWISSASRA